MQPSLLIQALLPHLPPKSFTSLIYVIKYVKELVFSLRMEINCSLVQMTVIFKSYSHKDIMK